MNPVLFTRAFRGRSVLLQCSFRHHLPRCPSHPRAPFTERLQVFNLGNTQPEKVSTLIRLLEQGLGRTPFRPYAQQAPPLPCLPAPLPALMPPRLGL